MGAAGRSGATPPAKPTGQAVDRLLAGADGLQPADAAYRGRRGRLLQPVQRALAVGPDGNLIPDLATEIPTVENGGISADGLNWRVKLRDDVKWHDGTPFTAEDVKFTLELINNPDFRAGRRAGHELVRDIKVVSPTEITWRMEKPYAPYPAILSWTFIVPKHILDKEADPNTSPFNNAPIGTGPFKWVERVPGDHITLAANTDYLGDGPYLERLIFKYIPDLTVLYTQFQTGDIDYIGLQGISADHYDEAKALADRVVTPVPQPFIENIAFNLGLPVFQDQAVREALYYAHGQAEHHRGDLLRPADADRILPAAAVLGLQSRPAQARARPGEGQEDPRRRRLGAGLRRRAREERRAAGVHQLDHRRQPCARAGAATAPAELAARSAPR